MTAKSAGNSHLLYNHTERFRLRNFLCFGLWDAWDRIKVGFTGYGQTVRSIRSGGPTWRLFFVLNTLQNTEMEGRLHKNDPLKINIKLVRAS